MVLSYDGTIVAPSMRCKISPVCAADSVEGADVLAAVVDAGAAGGAVRVVDALHGGTPLEGVARRPGRALAARLVVPHLQKEFVND